MSRLDVIDLLTDTMSLQLIRAQSPEFNEARDVDSFRAPFGETWHGIGSGHALPGTVRVIAVLDGGSLAASDNLLEDLTDALQNVHTIRIGDWKIPVLGAVGGLSSSPTLTGWAVSFELVLGSGPWHAATNLTVDTTAYTVDSTLFTADQTSQF